MTRDDIERRFIEISQLQPNWDDYEAEIPNKNSVDLSRKIIDIIGCENILHIEAYVGGGIGITAFKTDIYIEILNELTDLFWIVNRKRVPKTKKETSLEELRTIVYTILNLRGDS